jgi:hypothetical protein
MPEHRVYCLRCFATLAEVQGASTRCDRCGFVNVAADRRVYWNRAPLLSLLERGLKVAAVLSTLLLCGLVAIVGSTGCGGGYAMATPLIPGIMLWHTASKLTRHLPYFRPAAVWCAILCAGLACVLLVFGPSLARPHRAALLAVTLLSCGLVRLAARRLHRWKMNLTRGAPRTAPIARG